MDVLERAECARPKLFGIAMDAVTMDQALARCTEAIQRGSYLSIGVVNAAKIMAMRHDDALRQAVTSCQMVVADGQSVVWASRLLRAPLPERVAGIDLFEALLREADRGCCRVYFLGAHQDTLARMIKEVRGRFPSLVIAGARHGYFDKEDENDIATEISLSKADMLFLGMSSPKKELFLDKWGAMIGAKVVHGVGGSFDILAGKTQRAPLWYQKHGLEWLYRVRQEPRRLARRYLTTNASFIILVARELLRLPAAATNQPTRRAST